MSLRAQRSLATGTVRRQFPSSRSTTWRNNGSSTQETALASSTICGFLVILTFTDWNDKCHVIIGIETDLSGFVVTIHSSLRQPLRVEGPKASQRSIITYEIQVCTDQVKTHRDVRFWLDLSYDATKVHGRMLGIKLCFFLFVFCRKVLPWDLVYKMAWPKTRDT